MYFSTYVLQCFVLEELVSIANTKIHKDFEVFLNELSMQNKAKAGSPLGTKMLQRATFLAVIFCVGE